MSMTHPLPTIGVDKYTFMPLTADTAETLTYGEAQSLPGTVQLSPTDSGGAAVFDADNGPYEATAYTERRGHEIINADIPPEVDAAWRGLEIKNGLLEISGDTKTVYFGVAWRILKADGSYRYARFYKGIYTFASNLGGKTKPSQGAVENQTAKAEFVAMKRIHDDKIYAYIDEGDIPENMTREVFEEEWFSDLTWEPEV